MGLRRWSWHVWERTLQAFDAWILSPRKGCLLLKKKSKATPLRSRMGTARTVPEGPAETSRLFVLVNAGKGKGPRQLLFCGRGQTPKHTAVTPDRCRSRLPCAGRRFRQKNFRITFQIFGGWNAGRRKGLSRHDSVVRVKPEHQGLGRGQGAVLGRSQNRGSNGELARE